MSSPASDAWSLEPGVTYLNHGSFGPPPEVVRRARAVWQERLDRQPMDFFVRQLEPALLQARGKLAEFVGAGADNLIFVENATVGMNIVADSFPLQAGEQVLLNDHEYGAVQRIWKRACAAAGAELVIATLPLPLTSVDEAVTALLAQATEKTRLLVVSHITSPTAITLPVAEVCRAAQARGIAVCIDGPHAVAQVPLAIEDLGCDFYTASCHKWLSAPFGSGFLSVAPRWQARIRPPVLSWGRLLPNQPASWSEEFLWSGTRDPSAQLAIPAAIGFLEAFGLDRFRSETHALARYARQRLVEQFQLPPIVPDDSAWYGAMAHVPLPPGDANGLQRALWQQYRIEVPIVDFRGGRYVRVSCHLYNTPAQVDLLCQALGELLA
jgi:isopenicillin-N epimerase